MASLTIDPSLLDKRTSGNRLPPSPEHTSPSSLPKPLPSHLYNHENPLDPTFAGEDWDFDLDLDVVATNQVVDIPDTVANGHGQHSHAWVPSEAAPPCSSPTSFGQPHAPSETNIPLRASSDSQDVLEYLAGDDREPWNPLQIGNTTYNIGLQLTSWQYPTYVRGPMQDRQNTLIETLFPDPACLQSDNQWCDTTLAQANHPGHAKRIQSVQEHTIPSVFPTAVGGGNVPIDDQIHPSWQRASLEQEHCDNCWPRQDLGSAEAQSYSGLVSAEQNCNQYYVTDTEAPPQDWPIFAMDEDDFHTTQFVSRRRISQCDAPHSQVLPSHDDLAFCGNVHNLVEDKGPSAYSWPRCNDANAGRRPGGSREQNASFHNVLQTQKRRRRITTSAFERPPGTGPLRFSSHNNQNMSSMLSPTGLVARASRRKGPLTQTQRTAAAASRKNKSICIRCRQNKISCDRKDDGLPCSKCLDLGKGRVWEQPCTKAHFLEIVESGTLNYISQRAINHFTLDQTRRLRLELPEAFDLQALLSLVDHRRGRYNIRARQASGSLYVLDLNQCFDYLSNIHNSQSQSQHNLRGFIDHDVLKADEWLGCVTECDPMTGVLSLLSTWNNMPSRASYDFVAVDGSCADLPMNVEDPDDQINIMIAAQLSRIVCRKLEVAGYETLQKVLNNWSKDPPPNQVQFVHQLGQILLTLRWRVSWWELLGDGGATQDVGKERFEYRVNNLCRVLYFYYCNVKKKLPAFADPKGLEGIWSSYADASSIYDDFPKVESIDGFDQWMQRGKELIVEAGVVRRMSVS